MVPQTPKRRRQKYCMVNYDENVPLTRSKLRKLVRAKKTPEIYKEVVRSQRRKHKLFRPPDVPSRSSSRASVEGRKEQLNEDINPCSALSTVTTSSDSDLQWQSEADTDTEDTRATVDMSQKMNKTHKSVSSEKTSVASPGVITRSQLKQLANARSVPEEYKHVVGGTQSSGSNRKHGKSPDTQKQSTPRRLSMTAKGRRQSKKVNEKEKAQSSSAQNNSLEVGESLDVEMHDCAGFSAEDHVNTPKVAGSTGARSRTKTKRRKEDKVEENALKNGETLSSSKGDEFNSVGDTPCDSSSGEHSNSKMGVSEGESVVTKGSVTVLSQDVSFEQNKASREAGIDSMDSKTDNIETDDKTDEENLRYYGKKAVMKSDVCNRKGPVGKKKSRKRKGFSKISSESEQEILDRIHPKERGNVTLERKNSICEPVDMSISEDCSGTEKIQYFAKSAPSDSEVSESFVENHMNSSKEISGVKGKTKLLKREKSINQGAPKSSEISSVTSSSYNSGYEITPSKSLNISKQQSLSTKTTDSGITGMIDSNPYCDSDSCTSDKQDTLENTQSLICCPDTITKEKRCTIQGESLLNNSSGSNMKTTNLLLTESIPSCSGRTSDVRQPFLIRMKPTIKEEPIDSDSDAESRKAIMLSAQRRIEQNLSTTDSEGRRFSSHLTPTSSLPDAEDSDDGPPESMTFEAGRNTATESLRDAVESIRRDRQRRKEKRRARLEKLRQQKEEKLIRLKERLASQEDASCSSSEESGYEDEEVRHYKKKPFSREKAKTEKEVSERTTKSKKKSSNIEGRTAKTKEMDNTQVDHHVGTNNGLTKRLPEELLERLSEKAPTAMKVTHSEQAEENGMNNNVISMQKKRKKAVLPGSEQSDEPSDSQSFKKPTNLDYIPLKSTGSTKFGIMSYDKVVNVSKSAAQKAAEFRQNMMFGNRHKREPANSGLIYQQKIKASGKAVFARKKY